MALCQMVPAFEPAMGLGVGTPKPLRRMRGPVAVGFRNGGTLDEAVEVIRGAQHVAVGSAACAGKSTRLPMAIAKGLDVLVVHVVPSAFLASELYRYLCTQGTGYSLVTEVEHDYPGNGVVVVPAAVVQAKFLAAGCMELPECVLFHDESHKSDAWTYLLVQQWGTIKGVRKYVTASATAGVGDYRKVETPGKVVARKYDAKWRDEDWSLFDQSGLPWEVSAINGNVLVFEDDRSRAEQLLAGYARAGFDVFRLHSRMSLAKFERAMEVLRDDAITILIADSSFRDGFTWPLSCIIDTGRVNYTSVVDNGPVLVTRDAYAFEAYQGAARGGRVNGESVEVWTPDVAFPRLLVKLEEVEMEAVALVSRLLSTIVPLEAMDAVMAKGRVPRDLLSALRGTMPLSLLRDTQLVVLASGGYERSSSPVLRDGVDLSNPGVDFVRRGVSADVANSYEFSTSGSSYTTSSTATTVSAGLESLDSWMRDAQSATVDLECGRYYHAPGVRLDKVVSAAFPEGWKSVVRVVSQQPGVIPKESMPDTMREVAVAAVLQRFNALSCELNAVGRASLDARKLAVGRAPVLLQRWLSGFYERATALQVEMKCVMSTLELLSFEYCSFEQLPDDCLEEQERALASRIVEEVRAIPDVTVFKEQAVEHVKKAVRVPMAVESAGHAVPPLLQDPAKYVAMAGVGRTARPVASASASGAFLKWVVGAKPGTAAGKVCERYDRSKRKH